MERQEDDDAAAYSLAVELEAQAWRELHAHAPGSPARNEAWRAWTDAIWTTNRAWRRMSGPHAPGMARPGQGSHAGA